MGWLSRKPTSNDPPKEKNSVHPWSGENDIMDLVALKLNDLVKRCSYCNRFTHINYLENNKCPDCRQ